jgi:hypothetical protein
MELLIARMEGIPAVLAAARANLAGVPRLWATDAVRNTRGTVSFLRQDLPAALAAQGADRADPALRTRFEAARTRAIGEMEGYAAWLEREVVPTARGDFRLGRAVFERKVKYEEFVDLSADQLRDVNERAIRDYHAWVAREAARIDTRRTPLQVMDSITRVHPTPEQLIPTARAQLDTIRRFIVERGIVTLPSDRMPVVRPTPEYARQGFASMDTPGPFEEVATEAFYNITNVDPAWTAEQKEQHLTYFNYPGLLGITVHEAMPGHFVQLLYRSQIPTEVRKVFTPSSLVEGWAHYTEQMMVDEGLGGGSPAVRLGQLRRAVAATRALARRPGDARVRRVGGGRGEAVRGDRLLRPLPRPARDAARHQRPYVPLLRAGPHADPEASRRLPPPPGVAGQALLPARVPRPLPAPGAPRVARAPGDDPGGYGGGAVGGSALTPVSLHSTALRRGGILASA